MWNLEKISALAPDPSTEKRGKGLAHGKDWSNLSSQGQFIWGYCKGSGSSPYQCQIDTHAPAFQCSCPVYKPPCKHSLGLFMLWAQQPALFAACDETQLPDWVKAWTEKRTQKTAKKPTEKTPEELEKSAAEKQKRWEKKLALMQDGIEELELWLLDLARQGFANVDLLNISFWERIAARMNDNQLPRVGSLLKECHDLILQQPEWGDLLTRRIGDLYLLVNLFKQRQKLSPAQTDDLLETVGVSIKKSELIAETQPIQAEWLVLGQKEDTDPEGRNFRRVWLARLASAEIAVVVDFSFGFQGYEQVFSLGTVLAAEGYYYPGSFQQRATLQNQQQLPKNFSEEELQPLPDLEALAAWFAQVCSLRFLLPSAAVLVAGLSPSLSPQGIGLTDQLGNFIPLTAQSEPCIYKLLGLSAGQPLSIFGIYNGSHLEPISCIWQGQLISLQEQLVALPTKTSL